MSLRYALCIFLLAWLCPGAAAGIDWDAYEQGSMGVSPRTEFQTSTFAAPLVHVQSFSKLCQNEGDFIFMTPRAERDSGNKVVILDQNGQLVWWKQERGAVSNLRPQVFKGRDFLTYWVGDDDYSGHGAGYYKMVCALCASSLHELMYTSQLDHKYQLAYAIRACKNVSGDYHEFSITQDNTALITAYVQEPRDLSHLNRNDGYIWDCIFQEINIETNELLFEWRASHHFTFADMAVNSWTEYTGAESNPWDWFHINSVEKDALGNYLVAARYTNAVTYVEGKTGRVLWNLGGRINSFTDRSGGGATRLVDPHMARRTHKGRGITLFDNVAYWSIDSTKKVSRGLEIYVNAQTLEARISKEFVHPGKLFGLSDGSMQLLDNGHYFISYGSLPVYAEFSASGKVLCEAHYSPINVTRQGSLEGSLKSYRTYKYPWNGQPDTPPTVAIEGDRMYVSWNGASTVHSWQLHGSSEPRWRAASSTLIGTFTKDGFETTLSFQDSGYASFKLVALESDGSILGQWSVRNDETLMELGSAIGEDETSADLHPWLLMFGSWVLILVFLNRRSVFRWKHLRL